MVLPRVALPVLFCTLACSSAPIEDVTEPDAILSPDAASGGKGSGGSRSQGSGGTVRDAAADRVQGAGGAAQKDAGGAGGAAPIGEAGPKGTGSLVCDGTATGVTVPHAADLEILGDFTIEMWMTDDEAFCHSWRFPLQKGDGYNDVYFVATEDCGVRIGHKVNWNYYCQLALLDGYGTSWLHYAATYRASDHMAQIYIDGEPQFDPMLSLDLTPEAKGQPVTMCDPFKGKLDDVRIWNVIRTPEQIQASYKGQLADVPAGLVANWTFDETSGTTAHDTTGHGHDGTMSAAAAFSTDVHP